MSLPKVTIATHASESGGHFYDQSGNQIGSVTSADGKKQVKCTLVHARKLGLVPGCTTIIGASDKPALTIWKMEQVALAAVAFPRLDSETSEDYVRRLLEASKVISKESAEEGSRIHAALQAFLQGDLLSDTYQPHVAGIMASMTSLGCHEWRSEVPCVSRLGYGTKADLVGYRHSKPVFLLDTKTKEGSLAELSEIKTYDEHHMQLAATRHALGYDGIPCGILFTSRTEPGATVIAQVGEDELKRGLEMFRHLLRYHQTKTKHRPDWANES